MYIKVDSSWSKEVILLIYLALVQPHLQYCMWFWALQYKDVTIQYKDVKVLESIQTRAKPVKGLEGNSCEERWALRLTSLEKRRLRGDLVPLCNSLRMGSGEGGTPLFSLVSSDRAHRNGSKRCQGRLRLDIRKNF